MVEMQPNKHQDRPRSPTSSPSLENKVYHQRKLREINDLPESDAPRKHHSVKVEQRNPHCETSGKQLSIPILRENETSDINELSNLTVW
jgi:hypothetical protein